MIQAVIFDLNGVLVTTDLCHFHAWELMAREHGLPFDADVYARIRGLSRQEAIEIILEKSKRHYTEGEKLALTTRKNDLYLGMIAGMNEESLLPGAIDAVMGLREMRIHTAVSSSSQNARQILCQLGIAELFDTVVDGNQVCNLKPDPEAFLLTAQKLKVKPGHCLVIEDTAEGVEAAHRGGMLCLAVGGAAHDGLADFRGDTLAHVDVPGLVRQENVRHVVRTAAEA